MPVDWCWHASSLPAPPEHNKNIPALVCALRVHYSGSGSSGAEAMAKRAAYGTWASPITAAAITAGQVGLAQPSLDRGCSDWLEVRPQEAGRTVLVRRTPQGAGRT
jgi:hypothetical protein